MPPSAGTPTPTPGVLRIHDQATDGRAQAGRAATDIVQLRSGVSLGEGGAIVRAAHGRVTGRLPIIHGLAVRLSRSARYTLTRDYRIAAVSANGRIRPQNEDLLDA